MRHKMGFWRWLWNVLGFRKDTLVCMRQENTYVWGSDLGKKTPGSCSECQSPIYFEEQNKFFRRKICHVCGIK